MSKTITFTHGRNECTIEAHKSKRSFPIIYTAYYFDVQRNEKLNLVFIQESDNSEILATLSWNLYEKELKTVILEKLNNQKHLFKASSGMI